MKKTLLVTAVATAMTAGAAQADLYGNIRLGLQSADEMDVVSGKLVFGFKGSEDLGGGMALSYGVEFEHDGADEESPGAKAPLVITGTSTATATISAESGNSLSNDKSWVGLSGGFGKVVIGEHSDMAGFACGATDVLYYGTAEGCSLGHNTSPANAIQYRGGTGDVSFGVAMTQDGSGDSDTFFGFQFAADNFSVGMQSWSPEVGETATQIGGHYSMGDITLGLTLGDNGADDDNTGTDISVSLPVGAGSVTLLVSVMDADDSDSTDLLYSASLGNAGYYGVEFNSNDGWDDDVITAFLGTNF